MNISRETEIEQLRKRKKELFDQNVLNILNGQAMYEEFRDKKLMGHSNYAPFNEAMCVHATTSTLFDDAFIQTRARGHHVSIEDYRNTVIKPLNNLFKKNYHTIVLWFGVDMFCQMNLLTLLAYLEQSQYKGKVVLNSFKEDEFRVNQMELTLGSYDSVYHAVLVNHREPAAVLPPVLHRAIELYLEMQTDNNAVVKYILENKHLPTDELLKQLFEAFPSVGYGDSQYMELIEKVTGMEN